MSEKKVILDAMFEMRDVAWRAGRNPRRWEINTAGLDALAMDPRVSAQDVIGSMLGKPFLGIPMTAMPRPDFSDDPKVDLIVDEVKNSK